ncbi:hypothetical protein SAMN05661010_02106 [Modicisalibacter muralis]|uniref:Uncharacterized protein n=1 Tax=Modicisalibacter muralis TaxID=119000 RepID=A0A1G9LIR0_9GAMM|nr:hypothetical protein [Halomonas muralis]SDL61703.1 hypothetical protein SAMN05661010_02106 [Halomonas muralis]
MKEWLEILWPRLDKPTSEQEKNDLILCKQHIKEIQDQPWERDIDAALEEARRLNDIENDRRKGADTKAGVYLAAVGALAPILTSLIMTSWDEVPSLSLRWITLGLLLPAVAYLLSSGLWAFQTLKVAASNRVDVTELVKAWTSDEPKAYLIKDHLSAVRLNRAGVNQKVSCIKMTHAFLLRTFLSFTLLLLVQGIWPPIASYFEADIETAQKNFLTRLIVVETDNACPAQPPLKIPSSC